ncbi:DUF3857 domain-containing protein [Cellvibrio japonicus]|nr:DUF3857 domain-containing protein [Cellvibrio japonicus]QEI15066.1 DUF3857 domain-containing protein [Cellvibrio japonicus]QEI18646.1 DUF3857 domain-containing protein [Cellvibrio japonicus]
MQFLPAPPPAAGLPSKPSRYRPHRCCAGGLPCQEYAVSVYRFLALPLGLLCLGLGLQALANTAPQRLAEPLPALAKAFKPDAGAGAEVIVRRTHIQLDEALMGTSHSYVAVYINSDEAARDYSQISVSFNSFYEDITLEFANVRTPDGKIDSIKADATQIQSPNDENFYHDRKELLFSLPNVRKGSIIEFQYRYTDTRKIIDGQWFDSFGFHWWEGRAAGQGSRADTVHTAEISISAPESVQLVFNDLGRFGIRHQVRADQRPGYRLWRWSGNQLAAVDLQSGMPREHSYTPGLRVGTIADWHTIARWADQLVEPHLVTDSKLDKVIADIRKTAKTPADKVKAVYQLLQDKVRYVFAHVGRGGYEPHDAHEVFTNGYGDCKDQSVLAVTLLRQLGIQANTALIATRSMGLPDMSVPAVTFDHMIVHIPAQPGLTDMWMDTTGDSTLFPGFSLGIEGQPALVVDEQTRAITTLPLRPASEHYARLNLVFDKLEGQRVEARFHVELGGMFEDRLRSLWQLTPERDKYFRELFSHIYSSADISELSTRHADSLWQGFEIQGRLVFEQAWGGGDAPLNYGFNLTQLIYLFSDLRNLHKPADRKQPYVNEPGYSLQAQIDFLRPDQTHQARVKSQGQNIDNAYYQVNQSGTDKGTHYQVEQSLTLKPVRVALADYADFYHKTQELLGNRDWTISYQLDTAATELHTLQQTGNKDSGHYIALAKHHMKQGQYREALDAAERAVKQAGGQKNHQAEAYYVLGLAQGYNNRLEESDAAFKKAEAMGFSL